MNISNIKKMVVQSSHYFYANVFIAISSLISFPILTRLLPVADYGLLGLLMTTTYLVIAFCKSGLQNSFIRFYEEYAYEKKRPDIYYSTFFLGTIPLCIFVVLVYLLSVNIFLKGFFNVQLRNSLSFIALLILFKAIHILFMSFWRAGQKTKLYNIFYVSVTYLSLSLGIVFLLLFHKNIYGILTGYLIAEFLASVTIILLLFKNYGQSIRIRSFSSKLFKIALWYGLPLLGTEFTAFLLQAGDRYVIAALMKPESLGLYTAAGNFTSGITSSLTFPISFAIVPIFMKIWIREGKQATQNFLSSVFTYFCLTGIPIIFGLTAVSKDALGFFASAKYISSYSIIPFLSAGAIIFGLYNMVNAGLLIEKKTFVLMLLTFGAGILNIILNFFLIYKIGLIGAAIATCISYLTLLISTGLLSFKYLSFKIDFLTIGKYVVYSLVMYLFIFGINSSNYLLTLIIKVLAGIFIYSILIIIFEKNIREKLVHYCALLKNNVKRFFCLNIRQAGA